MANPQPQRFGRYWLMRLLAQGGMAEIWLAREDSQPDRDVVVKRIHAHLATEEQFVMMFLDEARVAARLDHPGCVEIFDLGCHEDSYFLAMEYIHGEDLRSIARQAREKRVPLPRKLAVEIVAGAAEGLHYAHDLRDAATGRFLNVVHRDVSPQNILVTYDGGVKIVDFGIAKAADQVNKTQAGVLKGKYAYMSPEQVGGGALDRRSDVFALGVLLYELTTGKRLFKAKTELETMRRITSGKIVPPTLASRGYPERLEKILMKALAQDREQRHDSADSLQRDLRTFLAEHRCMVLPEDLAEFMRRIFADRLEAERAARALGDQEAFLAARFGDDSGSDASASGVDELASDPLEEIEIELIGEPAHSGPAAAREPPSPLAPPPAAPARRAGHRKDGASGKGAAAAAARLPSPEAFEDEDDPDVPTLIGELGALSNDEHPNPAFDSTDPLRTVSEIFLPGSEEAGDDPRFAGQWEASASSKRGEPRPVEERDDSRSKREAARWARDAAEGRAPRRGLGTAIAAAAAIIVLSLLTFLAFTHRLELASLLGLSTEASTEGAAHEEAVHEAFTPKEPLHESAPVEEAVPSEVDYDRAEGGGD